jgi:hypothetical protein
MSTLTWSSRIAHRVLTDAMHRSHPAARSSIRWFLHQRLTLSEVDLNRRSDGTTSGSPNFPRTKIAGLGSAIVLALAALPKAASAVTAGTVSVDGIKTSGEYPGSMSGTTVTPWFNGHHSATRRGANQHRYFGRSTGTPQAQEPMRSISLLRTRPMRGE